MKQPPSDKLLFDPNWLLLTQWLIPPFPYDAPKSLPKTGKAIRKGKLVRIVFLEITNRWNSFSPADGYHQIRIKYGLGRREEEEEGSYSS